MAAKKRPGTVIVDMSRIANAARSTGLIDQTMNTYSDWVGIDIIKPTKELRSKTPP